MPAAIPERVKAQVKRGSGKLIWSLDDCHDVVSSLRPEYIFHGHSKRLRHLLSSARFEESLAFLTP